MLERRVELRWRDMDAYGHVNNAVYLNYLEEARDAWIQEVLGKVTDTWDFVLARVAIDFKQELKQEDGAVLVRCGLDSFGRSSVPYTRGDPQTGRDDLGGRGVGHRREGSTGRPVAAAERSGTRSARPRAQCVDPSESPTG